MQDFPHHYVAYAKGEPEGAVRVVGRETVTLECAPPIEFGGPGDMWSPSELLLGAAANCFVLSFRAIARASGLEWHALTCSANGTLDRLDRVMRFTQITVIAELRLTDMTHREKAERLLQKAEASCLITNSMLADSSLNCTVKPV